MASLQHENNGNFQHICGATIISEKFVLTAAHCVFGKNPSDLKLVFGTDRLNFLTSSSSERNITQITIHPSYDNNYFYNDTAILELDLELNFDLTTSAICLPKSFNKNPNSRQHHSATITGWGTIQNNGQASKELRQGLVTIFSQDYCNDTRTIEHGNSIITPELLPKLFQSEVLCAGIVYFLTNREP